MHRHWLTLIVFALSIPGMSACNRNQGTLPKTEGNPSTQAPHADQRSNEPPAGPTSPGR